MSDAALSARELQVLRLAATGVPNKAIGHIMGISIQTAKNCRSSAYAKLGVSSAVEAFIALGWLTVPPDGPAVISIGPSAFTWPTTNASVTVPS